MSATVALHHELPDGSTHVDWMLQRDGEHAAETGGSANDRVLVTFRLDAAPHDLGPGSTSRAIRLADHRARYLHFEGPIGGDRGLVSRLARGTILLWRGAPEDERWTVEIHWPAAGIVQRIALEHREGDEWTMLVT